MQSMGKGNERFFLFVDIFSHSSYSAYCSPNTLLCLVSSAFDILHLCYTYVLLNTAIASIVEFRSPIETRSRDIRQDFRHIIGRRRQ